MDFKNAKELLALCQEHNMKISEVMLAREVALGEADEAAVLERLTGSLNIMKNAAHGPIVNPVKSLGGLIGGEGKKITDAAAGGQVPVLCGEPLTKAIAYAMAVLEVNGTMGLIVAAPTAGSAGVMPGVLIGTCEHYGFGDDKMLQGLLNGSALGYLLMRNASVSGAEAGCQAEVGAASAMAASALVELFGGTPEQCLSAASMAMSNLLGLACDPIAGLVEAPCQSRNAIGAANAFTCAQLALADVLHHIPFDEMAEAMYQVGCSLPVELRETALGGNAGTPTGCALCGGCK
ncbi:MAG: L-serine ammonia-lyase, iron-sulfur-dependent, subunit alpha [Firmicutes bacterium]|nr:L-serine ammonia-lyase, iron-sulfur-dependent, subunit alpha [Bacillota bacterium]